MNSSLKRAVFASTNLGNEFVVVCQMSSAVNTTVGSITIGQVSLKRLSHLVQLFVIISDSVTFDDKTNFARTTAETLLRIRQQGDF